MDTPSTLVENGVAGFPLYDADTWTMNNGAYCSGKNPFEIPTC